MPKEDKYVMIHGEKEFETEKAVLVELPSGEEIWIPKSQMDIEKSDFVNGEFVVKEWIAKKNGWV